MRPSPPSKHLPQDTPLQLGLLGSHIEKSLSPHMQSTWLKELGLEGSYQLFQAQDDASAKLMVEGLCKASGFVGLNITLPFKETVLSWGISSRDPWQQSETVRLLGAANTLYRNSERKLEHFLQGWALENTDVHGIRATLDHLLAANVRHPDSSGPFLEDSANPWSCIVVGNGGAARAVPLAVSANCKSIVYLCRTPKAMPSCGPVHQSVEFAHRQEILENLKGQAIVVINTVPSEQTDWAECLLREWANAKQAGPLCYFDMSYHSTKSVELCAALKIRSALGKLMLQEQGRRSFELWTGLRPRGNPLEDSVLTQ